MKKIDESNQISEAVDTIVGEVISDEKPNDGKQQTGLKRGIPMLSALLLQKVTI